MGKAECGGVEHLARRCGNFFVMPGASVDEIAKDRMAKMGEVNANLVRASGVELALDEGGLGPLFLNCVSRVRGASACFDNGHFLA